MPKKIQIKMLRQLFLFWYIISQKIPNWFHFPATEKKWKKIINKKTKRQTLSFLSLTSNQLPATEKKTNEKE